MSGPLALPPRRRIPKVPFDRRIAAFALDFGSIATLSAFSGGLLYIPVFLLLWLGMRVLVAGNNKGQSLGRWAFDMRVAELNYGATPGLLELAKRESMTGFGALLAMVGLASLSPTNGWILILPLPLLVDCGMAFADPEFRQAFHDQIARTVVVESRRGYSLDIKVKKLIAEAQRRVK
jgi:uncharacterized RDD family membrane protein YckC